MIEEPVAYAQNPEQHTSTMDSTPTTEVREPRATTNRSNESTAGLQHPKSMEAVTAAEKGQEAHGPNQRQTQENYEEIEMIQSREHSTTVTEFELGE
jgi:hypothetical protein